MVLAKTIGVLLLIGLVLWIIFAVIGFLAATFWTILGVPRRRRDRRRGVPLLQAPEGHWNLSCRLYSSGGVAEWLGRGLQSPVLRFESGRRLERDASGMAF